MIQIVSLLLNKFDPAKNTYRGLFIIVTIPGVRTKNEEFRGIFVLRPLLSILQTLLVAVK